MLLFWWLSDSRILLLETIGHRWSSLAASQLHNVKHRTNVERTLFTELRIRERETLLALATPCLNPVSQMVGCGIKAGGSTQDHF